MSFQTLLIWVLVEESVTTNGGFIDGFFCSSCRLLQQSEEKTKAFLTSLTSFQELHLMWVWVTPFFVSFNEHNYFNFLTVTRTINLRRCMAPDLKYTSFLKTGRSFFENLVVWLSKKRLYVGYVLLVFAFQMQTKKKQGFKIDFNFRYTSVTLLSPFNEKCFCFCFKTFLMFWLSVKNFAFCYLAFVSSGFFRLVCGSKCPVNESELLCGYMAYDLRLFTLSSSSPKRKIHKKVVEYSTDRPSTHLRRKFNWFQLSAFLQEKKLNSLLLSANERSEFLQLAVTLIWSP